MADEIQEETIEETSEVEEEGREEKKVARNAEQFEKLTKSNQELKEERDKFKKLYETAIPAQQKQLDNATTNLAPDEVDEVVKDMISEDGIVDGNKLLSTLTTLNKQAKAAQEAAKEIRDSEAKRQQRERDESELRARTQVYEKYPQLNPEKEEGFDPNFWKAVYNELAVKARKGEMPSESDYLAAADDVYNAFYKEADMTKQDQEIKQEADAKKLQTTTLRPNSTAIKGYYANEEDKNLIESIRAGKRGALAEKLRRLGQ